MQGELSKTTTQLIKRKNVQRNQKPREPEADGGGDMQRALANVGEQEPRTGDGIRTSMGLIPVRGRREDCLAKRLGKKQNLNERGNKFHRGDLAKKREAVNKKMPKTRDVMGLFR